MAIYLDILILIGSISLFLYGMKTMSEALQKIAGSRMRYILRTMTNSPIKQVLIGTMITAVIQSSSATTVMIVSFVNAGLLSLLQAVGIIMGANIGTTLTIWVISLLGFSFNLCIFAMPLIGLGFPLLLRKTSRTRAIGNAMIGFALLFVSIAFLRGSLASIMQNQEVLSFIANISCNEILSYIIFLCIGAVLTIIIKSSIATMTLTMLLCSQGIIEFECGMAMILGENIGITITSAIATSSTNISARRAAMAHLLFNVFGVLWILIFLNPIANLISYTVVSLGGVSPISSAEQTPIALALFHTIFNVTNTILLIGFTKNIAELVTRIIKDSPHEDKNKLKYIDSGMFATGAISIVQAQQAMKSCAQHSSKLFDKTTLMFRENNNEQFYALFEDIDSHKRSADYDENAFNNFLVGAMKGDVGNEAKEHIRRLTKLATELEIVSNCIYSVAKVIKRKKDKNVWFTPELRIGVEQMFELTKSALETMNENLDAMLNHKVVNIDRAHEIEHAINTLRTQYKDTSPESEDGDQINFLAWVIFSDIISKTEQLADSVARVSIDACKAIKSTPQSKK